MFVNVHQLPADLGLFTLGVTSQPPRTWQARIGGYDEVDVVARRDATVAEVIRAADDALARDYPDDARVVLVIDQRAGVILAEDFDGDFRPRT